MTSKAIRESLNTINKIEPQVLLILSNGEIHQTAIEFSRERVMSEQNNSPQDEDSQHLIENP